MLRAGLMRQVAELMMDKFVLRLISQREQLLNTQHQSSRQITSLDARLANIQKRMEERIVLYEKRIAQLKEQLSLKEAAANGGTTPKSAD